MKSAIEKTKEEHNQIFIWFVIFIIGMTFQWFTQSSPFVVLLLGLTVLFIYAIFGGFR